MLSALAHPKQAPKILKHCEQCSACAALCEHILAAEKALAPEQCCIDCDDAEAIDPNAPAEHLAQFVVHLRHCTSCYDRILVWFPSGLFDHRTPWEKDDPSATLLSDKSSPPAWPELDEVGNGRFKIIRRLGSGGMGMVYEAFDRKANATVALKTLRGPHNLRRLKNEFRARADVQHRNLVTLKEHFEDQGRWFVTMELVRGIDFVSYVRTPPPTGTPSVVGCDEARLRLALRQLALGLRELHKAGKIHRDIKPHNILIDKNDRLVLLDFGLIADTNRSESLSGYVVGTPAYMAPEQAAARRVSPAADWYSVGVILYEALTNRLPFSGTRFKLFMTKQREQPPAPRELVPGVDPELDALCMKLLAFSPEMRPDADEVLSYLGASITESADPNTSVSNGHRHLFVGRDDELATLQAAYQRLYTGSVVTVLVDGESGVGKSALVQQFAQRWLPRADEHAVCLMGRCYERESVPYKALDTVVDALALYLRQLWQRSRVEAKALLPRNARLLGQVFPVLRDTELISTAPALRQVTPDPLELRAQVFTAMRDLLARIADRQRLVLVIDDLQWSDKESLTLLAEIVRPPDPPPLLFVGTLRNGASGQTDESIAAALGEVTRIPLSRLQPSTAQQLTERLFKHHGLRSRDDAEALAAEAGGHPMWIHELVRHLALALDGGEKPKHFRLDDVLWSRICSLEPSARRIVELIAVAGTPLAHDTLSRAAGSGGEAFSRHLSLLSVAKLLRTAHAPKSDCVEPFHDRVREAVLANLGTEAQRECHEKLANALDIYGDGDPETLAIHWAGAGHKRKASVYAIEAAERADNAYAFDRAARLYRKAIDLDPSDPNDPSDPSNKERWCALHVKLGKALRNAGRSAAAAEAFRTAAASAPAAQALEYQRQAAENLFYAGHVAEGKAVLNDLLASVGIQMPKTENRALMSVAIGKLRFWILGRRGLRFRERHESQVDKEQLSKLDICWTGSVGLAGVDLYHSVDLHTRHIKYALAVGEPYRIARGLALEAVHRGFRGLKNRRQAEDILATAEALAKRLNSADALGRVRCASGICAYAWGEWKNAQEYTTEAESILRNRCVGFFYEMRVTQLFLLGSLFYRGELADLAALAPRLVREARERANRYAQTSFLTGLPNIRWLAADDVDGAREARLEAMNLWTHSDFLYQHKEDLLARQHIELYVGNGTIAWDEMQAAWPQLKGAGHFRNQYMHAECRYARGRSALAAALDYTSADKRKPLLDQAEDDVRYLERDPLAWTTPMATALRAGMAALNQRDEDAIALLHQAENGFDSAGMGLYTQAARRMRGVLMAGSAGAELVDKADEWMQRQNIARPDQMARVMLAGLIK